MSTLMIFGGKAPTGEKCFDDASRAERLREVERIVAGKNISGIRVSMHLDAACCLYVVGDEGGLQTLQNVLKSDGIDTHLSDEGPRFMG